MQPEDSRRSDSDSDDDPDYVPPTHDVDSDEERLSKRVKTGLPESPDPLEGAEAKASNREALWASFTSATAAPQPSTLTAEARKKVKVEKRYTFAGEDVVKVEEVYEDSDDAKKWPRWNPEKSDSSQPVPTSSTPVPQKTVKKPGPRKPKTLLTPLPGSQKAKKLTTLDKSAMDWKAHVDNAQKSEGMKDQLDANRRGGGYLEKVEFLQRVEQRKEDALEANKSQKRRRG